MRFEKWLFINKGQADIINRYLTEEPNCPVDCLGEDVSISNTVRFENGLKMDIKCCGVQFEEGRSNTAWTEAVLFKDGAQVCCTEPSDEYLGEWVCEYDGNEYVVIVEAKE